MHIIPGADYARNLQAHYDREAERIERNEYDDETNLGGDKSPGNEIEEDAWKSSEAAKVF